MSGGKNVRVRRRENSQYTVWQEKINFYMLELIDGLCFVSVNGALKLITAWLSGLGKKQTNKVKYIKPPAVPKRIQGASGPHKSMWLQSLLWFNFLLCLYRASQ